VVSDEESLFVIFFGMNFSGYVNVLSFVNKAERGCLRVYVVSVW
jgi:hypothetical protein